MLLPSYAIDASRFFHASAPEEPARSRGNWNDIVCASFYPVRSFRCPVTSVPVRFWCPWVTSGRPGAARSWSVRTGVIVLKDRAHAWRMRMRETETRDGALRSPSARYDAHAFDERYQHKRHVFDRRSVGQSMLMASTWWTRWIKLEELERKWPVLQRADVRPVAHSPYREDAKSCARIRRAIGTS